MTAAPRLLDDAPARGELFAGKYRVQGVIGVGGMGYVLAAEHVELRERVAIKMLRPEHVADATCVERFLREGRAAVKIKSEHVARVLDVARLPDERPYLVMEHLDGADLGAVLRDEGPVPVDRAVRWVLQACEAIAEAHAMGIVHRDLKPSNLFLTRRPDGTEHVKVLDFGVSKTTAIEPGSLTTTGSSVMLGSPHYMSPEQLRGAKDVDVRSDIWSLGVIIFELVSGERPFDADTIAELGALVLSGSAPWLSNVAPHVPTELATAVATCLRRDPARRFVNLADFAGAFAPFGGERARASAERVIATVGMPPVRAKRWTVPEARPEPDERDVGGALASDPARTGHRTTRTAGVAALIVAAAVAGAVVASARSAPSSPAAPSPPEPPSALQEARPTPTPAIEAPSATAAEVPAPAAAARDDRPAPRRSRPPPSRPAPSASSTQPVPSATPTLRPGWDIATSPSD